jgi:DNA-binding MarR family transcriptional regulator
MAARSTPFRQTVPFTMHRVTALTVANATAEFAHYGVNIQGARVLVVVRQNPGIRIGDVAEITCIEPSTLSHMLRRFERDALMTRRRPPDDHRAVILTLTPRGRKVAERVHEIVNNHQRTMLAGISKRDIAVLRRALARMAANAQAAAERLA